MPPAPHQRSGKWFIHAVGEHEVDNANVAGLLADTIDAADTLLHAGRVPRKVVVDKRTGDLKVETFARRIRTEQDPDLSSVQTSGDLLLRYRTPAPLLANLSAITCVTGKCVTVSRKQRIA